MTTDETDADLADIDAGLAAAASHLLLERRPLGWWSDAHMHLKWAPSAPLTLGHAASML